MSLDYLGLSNKCSAKSLLNSFIRDYHEDERVLVKEGIELHLSEGTVLINFEKKSLLGQHCFRDDFSLNGEQINFEKLVKLLAMNFASNPEEFESFVISSRDNISQILESNLNLEIKNYLDSEKQLLLGHPFHPYPKCKEGMDKHELAAYSPELDGVLKLFWLKVNPSVFYSNYELETYKESLKTLVEFDLGQADKNSVYVPMHPWQWRNIKPKGHFTSEEIEELGQGRNTFHALSSMRSLYNEHSPLLPKFSMDIRLTNSIRHLQLEESIRGEQVDRVLDELTSSNLALDVLREPFFCGLKSKQGEVLADTIVQFRENFKSVTDLSQTYLLSSLCEINPITHKSLAHAQIESMTRNHENNIRFARKHWFSNFLDHVVSPFLELSIEHGVLLGAHMQNILVTIKDNVPYKATYRDCQGSGLSEQGYSKFSDTVDTISKDNGNILSDSDVNKVFGYYLVVNTIFSTISSLAKSDESIEFELLNDFRTFIYKLNKKHNSTPFLEYILNSKYLYQKGNARCCLLGINENTTSSPWDIYNKIENPIQKLRKLKPSRSGTLYQATNKKGVSLSFRVMEERDLDLFHKWHNQDFVSEFWELNQSREKLREYFLSLKNSSYQLPLIFEVENTPVGYFEAYWAYDDRIAPYSDPDVYDRGIHLLIGEKSYLKTRIVYDSLMHVSKFLLEDDERTQRVYGEPRADNIAILKLSERLPGWELNKFFNFPHKKAALLECDRTRFFKELDRAL
ncbi:MAG: GNAT family N-acetyltransferase [Bacteriovoracaceae bacterium]|nr:GNAT family N-acetyltransferase [Bacteriovoracaceae bacterium]